MNMNIDLNVEQARTNMLTQQLRAGKVLNEDILDIVASVPRENFVPSAFKQVAFADKRIPLPNGQFMMLPQEEGLLLQAVNPKATDTVLEIGTGSGYVTALLAKMAKMVYSLEIDPSQAEVAKNNVDSLGIVNAVIINQDGSGGYPESGPYDAIVIHGALQEIPALYREQLAIGGRLFVILGTDPVMEALMLTRESEQEWTRRSLFDTTILPLKNVKEAPFTF